MMIAGLVLAAGSSKRMGSSNKLLQTMDAQPMVATVLTALLNSSVDSLWVVTGFQSDKVTSLLAKLSNDYGLKAGNKIHCIENPDYAQGLSTSLRCGIQALPASVEAVMIVQADMPMLSAAHFERLLAVYKKSNHKLTSQHKKIIAPFYRQQRGNPIIFPRRFFNALQTISGDQGARQLLTQLAEHIVAVEMADDAVLIDVDTPAQLQATRRALGVEDER